MIRALALFFLAARPSALPNARVMFEVKQAGVPSEHWQLWTDGPRAHLRSSSGVDVFYDLQHERRLDLRNGRSRDEPISFGKLLKREEIFPRGVRLTRRGGGKLLGKKCQRVFHQQEELVADGTRKLRSSWCVWNGIPLTMDFEEVVCNRAKKCLTAKSKWTALELTMGAAKASDFPRAPSTR
jgi:hypothetical protein